MHCGFEMFRTRNIRSCSLIENNINMRCPCNIRFQNYKTLQHFGNIINYSVNGKHAKCTNCRNLSHYFTIQCVSITTISCISSCDHNRTEFGGKHTRQTILGKDITSTAKCVQKCFCRFCGGTFILLMLCNVHNTNVVLSGHERDGAGTRGIFVQAQN